MVQGSMGKRALLTNCFLFTVDLEGDLLCSFVGGYLKVGGFSITHSSLD